MVGWEHLTFDGSRREERGEGEGEEAGWDEGLAGAVDAFRPANEAGWRRAGPAAAEAAQNASGGVRGESGK
ncbi:hypothetical protein OsJ_36148 [Oryza sativa Japonica Group]|nr:hypothetical protein OsJ_36148 [Oryza sativa Japonica Group]